MSTFILAYPHWKSKAMIKRALNNKLTEKDLSIKGVKHLNSFNPLIDFIEPFTRHWATPKEILAYSHKNEFTFTNKKRSFFGKFVYDESTKKWSMK